MSRRINIRGASRSDLDTILSKGGWGLARSGFARTYEIFHGTDFEDGVVEYVLSQPSGIPGHENETLADVANQYGCGTEFGNYIHDDLIKGRQAMLRKGFQLAASLKDSIDDAVAVAALTAEGASAVETLGGSVVAIEVGGKTVEVPLKVAASVAYNLISGALGYASGTYERNLHGVVDYAVDVGLSVGGDALESIPVLGRLISLGINPDDKLDRVHYAFFRDARKFLMNKIGRGDSIDAVISEPELGSDLERMMPEMRAPSHSEQYASSQIAKPDYISPIQNTVPFSSYDPDREAYANDREVGTY